MRHVLAFEGGGTRTTAGFYTAAGELLAEAAGGPSNPVAYGMEACLRTLVGLGRTLLNDEPGGVIAVAGIAGAIDLPMRIEIARGICAGLGVPRARVTEDLHPPLTANARWGAGIYVIAGTGSNVLGQAGDGRTAQAGGRGSAFGDEGSAYQIGMRALAAAAAAVDGVGPVSVLPDALAAAAGAVDFAGLTPWANAADKQSIADLSRVVVQCADRGDAAARGIIEGQARRLAEYVSAVYARLDLDPGTPVLLNGGMFENCAMYRAAFDEAVASATGLRTEFPELRGHRAVFSLAALEPLPPWLAEAIAGAPEVLGKPCGAALSPTEQAGPDAVPLDQLDAEGMVAAMCAADAAVPGAVAAQAGALAQAVAWAGDALRQGGRIMYVGAGTSGRLGVLDASECPPTFGVAAGRVAAIMAGGDAALRGSVEGAEDDAVQGAADVAVIAPGPGDVVVGIAASGTTPYTLAALAKAREAGARTVLLCCNPAARAAVDLIVALDTGPEILPGSTRLKAGTATKLALNILSTGAMARAGHVLKGRMVGVRAVNEKLRCRAARITAELSGLPEDAARRLLEAAEWRIPVALLMARYGLSAERAARHFAQAPDLRAALDQPPR